MEADPGHALAAPVDRQAGRLRGGLQDPAGDIRAVQLGARIGGEHGRAVIAGGIAALCSQPLGHAGGEGNVSPPGAALERPTLAVVDLLADKYPPIGELGRLAEKLEG
jgi:hypothetical protein